MHKNSEYEIYILKGYSESIMKCDFKHKKSDLKGRSFLSLTRCNSTRFLFGAQGGT